MLRRFHRRGNRRFAATVDDRHCTRRQSVQYPILPNVRPDAVRRTARLMKSLPEVTAWPGRGSGCTSASKQPSPRPRPDALYSFRIPTGCSVNPTT
eukprot:12904053-Alexandrium_andersonii.AAC.2